jgi:ferrous iron transport protein B
VGYRIALVGNPNTGKTTLFNRLRGARAKTSNFPGTTTAARIGRATLANGAARRSRDRRPAGPLPARDVDARIRSAARSGRQGLY